MSCALCQQDKPLRRSHIVPEFMYKTMYDSDHTFFALSPDPAKRVQRFRKGLREPLLCGDCEQLFGRHETYMADVFFGKRTKGRIDGNMLMLYSLDYAKVRLFFLSLLWRFGITNIPLLKGAQLGPHAETLRGMLLAENPGTPLQYPFFVTAVTRNRKHISDLLLPPCLAKFEGHHAWSFVVAGILLTFFVSSHSTPVVSHAFLQRDGMLRIGIKEITEIPFLHRYASEIATAEQIRATAPTSRRSRS